jgi:hypothetical protein
MCYFKENICVLVYFKLSPNWICKYSVVSYNTNYNVIPVLNMHMSHSNLWAHTDCTNDLGPYRNLLVDRITNHCSPRNHQLPINVYPCTEHSLYLHENIYIMQLCRCVYLIWQLYIIVYNLNYICTNGASY